jgi:hypothetical protein
MDEKRFEELTTGAHRRDAWIAPPPRPTPPDPAGPPPRMILGMEIFYFWLFVAWVLFMVGVFVAVLLGVK